MDIAVTWSKFKSEQLFIIYKGEWGRDIKYVECCKFQTNFCLLLLSFYTIGYWNPQEEVLVISLGVRKKFLLQAGHTAWHPISLEPQKNLKMFQKEQTPQVRAATSFSTIGLWIVAQNWVLFLKWNTVICLPFYVAFLQIGLEWQIYSDFWIYEYISVIYMFTDFLAHDPSLILSKLRSRKWWKETASILELCHQLAAVSAAVNLRSSSESL